jgi:hypothetical protein
LGAKLFMGTTAVVPDHQDLRLHALLHRQVVGQSFSRRAKVQRSQDEFKSNERHLCELTEVPPSGWRPPAVTCRRAQVAVRRIMERR